MIEFDQCIFLVGWEALIIPKLPVSLLLVEVAIVIFWGGAFFIDLNEHIEKQNLWVADLSQYEYHPIHAHKILTTLLL